jgi:hypothetical protein
MSTKNHLLQIVILLIAAFALSACASPAAVASSVTSQPAAAAVSLPVATRTSQPAPTSTTASAVTGQTSASQFDGLSSGLDNATQARIRLISAVMGAPNTDVYVNGMLAFNGGVAQQNIAAGQFSGWLYVTPGTYTIALVPHGGTMDQALFPPTDVKVEAGHRYTVAAMGQLADNDVHPLIVDETALEAGLGAGITDSISIDINNVTGADSLSDQAYGESLVKAENIKYGEVRAWFCPSGNPVWSILATKDGKTETVWTAKGFAEPGASFAIPWFGPYPASNLDSVGNASQGTSELNVVDFLQGFDGRNLNMDGHPISFSILLAAIDKAGLRDQLINGGPYFLMAPTDAALQLIPQAERDALLNDPEALLDLFKAHIVDGYYPSGSLSGATYGHADRTLTNQLGNDLVFEEDNLNGKPIGPNYTVGNGNRVQIIFNLLPYK